MTIKEVLFVPGSGGYFNMDLAAIKQGGARDGFLYRGMPATEGFRHIVEPGACLSVLLVLDNGQVAVGDGASVILAGTAGRDLVFRPEECLGEIYKEVRDTLVGSSLENAREPSRRIDALRVNSKPLHTAVRYGVTQAIYAAVALAKGITVSEVIADEYNIHAADRPIRLLGSCEQEDALQIDRIILKRADLLPHGGFGSVEKHLGLDGETLLRYASSLASRIRTIGDDNYRPGIHFDMYGSIGELFPDEEAAAAYIDRVAAVVAPFPLLIESPIIKPTQPEQFESYARLRAALARRGSTARIILDEWCNTLADIEECARLGAADYVQIKTPDLGGVNNIIEAVLACRNAGIGSCLGGSANETDISARMTAQIGLACQPDFLMTKPGLGFDEGFLILRNEMLRTLALINARRSGAQRHA